MALPFRNARGTTKQRADVRYAGRDGAHKDIRFHVSECTPADGIGATAKKAGFRHVLLAALKLLAGNVDAVILAGGQSLIPAMNFRLAQPSTLVDIQHVARLRGIFIAGGECAI